jgi:hypothetical protein
MQIEKCKEAIYQKGYLKCCIRKEIHNVLLAFMPLNFA